jgi:hypothetical protein
MPEFTASEGAHLEKISPLKEFSQKLCVRVCLYRSVAEAEFQVGDMHPTYPDCSRWYSQSNRLAPYTEGIFLIIIQSIPLPKAEQESRKRLKEKK